MTRPEYPPAAALDVVDTLHGRPVADPYRWLEDPSSAQTQDWARAQQALFAAQRATWPGRDTLRDRLAALLGAGLVTAPTWRGQRQFLMRRHGEQEHAVLLVVEADGAERVLVDPIALDPAGLTTLDSWSPSPDGRLLAYQLSEGGSEESTLAVLDVASGAPVDGPIDRTRYSPVAWLPDGGSFYYVRRLDPALVPPGEEQFHRRVWLHRLGDDPAGDALVFGQGRGATDYYGVSLSRDGRWLVVSAAEGTAPRNDLWLADLAGADAAAPPLRVVQVGEDVQTGIHVGRDGRAYVATNRDAPRGRVAVTDPATPTPDTWVDLVGQDDEAVLEDFAVLDADGADTLLVAWTRHGLAELTVHDLATGARRGAAALPGLGSIGGLSEHPDGDHRSWFNYTDHVTPPLVLVFDALADEDQAVSVWANAPGSVAVPAVISRQETFTSADGTEVRVVVMAPADAVGADGRVTRPRPAVLYGYGGFGLALTPGYSAGALAWVEAGGVYAVAGLRGGGEEGEEWHRGGMLEHKQNVFDDFAAAARHLVDSGWTTPAQLSVSGGSNGGLLVGAAITQFPEMLAAAVCSAPLLDMVRYEEFGLGATWAVEYGSAADPDALAWLLAYSPYHRVRAGVNYPAVLFTVFDGDTRVDPLHARKMCAALQAATAGDRPVLLRAESDVGHGARSLSRSVELIADTLAFTAAQTGLALPG